MTETLDLFRRGLGWFGNHVRAIRDDQWELPTPATEWDVRALVRHLVHEVLWVPELLAGKTLAQVGDRFDGDILGDDPKAAYARAASAAVEAVEEPGAAERIVHLSYGAVPGSHYAFELGNDLWVHGWDLARAIGGDERIDPDVAEALYRFYQPLEPGLKASGLFGPNVEPPPGSDTQTKLLAVMGRRSW